MNFKANKISLDWYSADEIIKNSLLEISVPSSLDMFGHPVSGGLYDLRMGPLRFDQICHTCKLGFLHCPGHFGHIKLSKVVLNPLIFDVTLALMKATCASCLHFRITTAERLNLYSKLKLVKRGVSTTKTEMLILNKTLEEIQEIVENVEGDLTGWENTSVFDLLTSFLKKVGSKISCPRCRFKSNKITKGTNMRILRNKEDIIEYITPAEIKNIFQSLLENERVLYEEMFGCCDLNMFFIEALSVIPNKFRPANYLNDKVSENFLNGHFSKIMNFSILTDTDEKYYSDLQAYVYFYFDSSKGPTGQMGHKQILEKKEGLFRKNIMGKRVNYSARSVISPDPNIQTREIGIPMVFAKELTFPEKVTKFNIEKLRKRIINGGNFPGANFIKNEDYLINLKYIAPERRLALSNQLTEGKTVYRHLEDGDTLLVNRQPTLHSVSLLGHQVKILKNENTLRLHYVNCKSYNADFDGDEMNVHFLQDFLATSEAKNLSMNDHAYFVPSNGQPIRGLTQDHIIAGMYLTLKDSFFTEEEYKSIVNFALCKLNSRLIFEKPVIINPDLYTGKQVITSILQNLKILINFQVFTKLKFKGDDACLTILGGKLLTGVLDKCSVGASSHSLIHACGELYGYPLCNDLLTMFSRAINMYMIIKAFTIRFDDLLFDKQANLEREAIFQRGQSEAIEWQRSFSQDPQKAGNRKHPMFQDEDFYFNQNYISVLDGRMRNFMNEITSSVSKLTESGMFKKFPQNNMMNVIFSGSKGSMDNLRQISNTLGQQELEGKRVPFMESGKTLPCFKKMELSPSAGGYVFERFLTGLNPATFYFHSMAGREGLIDTAVKTANSGYLQRCLAKHLEGVFIHNDFKVMSNSNIIQFKYGDDGIDCTKESYLKSIELFFNNFNLLTHSNMHLPVDDAYVDHIPSSFSNDVTSGMRAILSRISDVHGIDYQEETQSKLISNIRTFMDNKFINSLADPGTNVGIIAAQSIGEPSTQMTLNTFHFAGIGGKNVTLGIPRLREIIMVASKNIRTPIIHLLNFRRSDELVAMAKCVTLKECLDKIIVEESLVVKNLEYKKLIKIIFDIRDNEIEAIKAIDAVFLKMLGKALRKRSSASGIVEFNETKIESKADSESDSSDDSENESAADCKPSEESHIESEINFMEDKENVEENSNEEETALFHLKKMQAKKYCFEIYYPTDFNVLLISILEGISENIIVREMPGFKKATSDKTSIILEGSDFSSLFNELTKSNFEAEDSFYHSTSNDIHSIFTHFGIEAARATIVSEIKSVFDVYGISINIRHLYLVADFMTKDGVFKAFSRNAFSMDDSFVQKMSFESCLSNLKNSSIFRQSDNLQGPSACIMVGSNIKSGTGAFDLLYDMSDTI